MAKTERGIARCLAFITEGDGDPGAVRETLKDLEARKRDLERRLADEAEAPAVEIHPNVAELYRRKVGELQSLLADGASRAEAMEIIRSLIERIEVHAGERRGEAQVVLVGALAQILDYASAETTTAASGGGGRVLMVAGARYQRYLRNLFSAIA